MQVTRTFRWLAASAFLVVLATPGCGRVSFQTTPTPSPSPPPVMTSHSGNGAHSTAPAPKTNPNDAAASPTPTPTSSVASGGGGGGSQSRYGSLRVLLVRPASDFRVAALLAEVTGARITVLKDGASPQTRTVGPEVLFDEQPQVEFTRLAVGEVTVTAEALGSEDAVLGRVETTAHISSNRWTELQVVLETDSDEPQRGSVTADVILENAMTR